MQDSKCVLDDFQAYADRTQRSTLDGRLPVLLKATPTVAFLKHTNWSAARLHKISSNSITSFLVCSLDDQQKMSWTQRALAWMSSRLPLRRGTCLQVVLVCTSSVLDMSDELTTGQLLNMPRMQLSLLLQGHLRQSMVSIARPSQTRVLRLALPLASACQA